MNNSNLLNHIKPVDTNVNTDPKFVTPMTQKYHKMTNITFDLFEIYKQEEIVNKFPPLTFPKIVETTGYELFIEPHDRIYNSSLMEETYIKWLVLGEDMEPINGHNYPMVKLPQDGYLMKIQVPNSLKLSDNMKELKNYQIDCIYPYRHFKIITEDNLKQMEENSMDLDIMSSLSIKSVDVDINSTLHSLLTNKEEFFDKYVKDCIK